MVRPDASWCSLCHADLRSEEEKAAARPPEPWLDEPAAEVPTWVQAADPAPDHVPVAATTGITSAEMTSADTASAAMTSADMAAAERRGRHARPSAGPSGEPQTVVPVGAASPVAAAESSPVATDVSGPSPDAVLTKAGIDVEAMMSLLAADQTKPLPSLSGRLASKGNRAIAAVVAVVALTAVGIVVMTLLGLFVH
jgi:hypothetical protein